MNILVLEDRGSVSRYMEEALKNEGHNVFSAGNVSDAISLSKTGKFDCLIIDLNMPSDGLTEEEKTQTEQGLLTGWVFLKNYVFKVDHRMRERTIVYTDYLERFRESVPHTDLEGVRFIPKKGSPSPAEQLMKSVNLISRIVENSRRKCNNEQT